MLILTLRTDNPEAELGLYEDHKQLAYVTWQAHRQLAETLHTKLKEMLEGQTKQLTDLNGLVAYQGPGSFTGLRIGLSVANALADSLNLAIIGESGDNWLETGIKQLLDGQNHKLVTPDYGSEVHITAPKK